MKTYNDPRFFEPCSKMEKKSNVYCFSEKIKCQGKFSEKMSYEP